MARSTEVQKAERLNAAHSLLSRDVSLAEAVQSLSRDFGLSRRQELDRRLAAARTAHPTKQRERALLRDLARTRKSIDRLLTAYQEDLLTLDELRQRMPELRHREHAMQAELQSIVNQVDDRAAYLRLAETISAFLTRLRTSADSLDVQDRQRIVRLVVKEILVGDDAITIRHAIPIPPGPPNDTPSSPRSTRSPTDQSYLLRSGRHLAAPCQYCS